MKLPRLQHEFWSLDVFKAIGNSVITLLYANDNFKCTNSNSIVHILVEFDLREGFIDEISLMAKGETYHRCLDYTLHINAVVLFSVPLSLFLPLNLIVISSIEKATPIDQNSGNTKFIHLMSSRTFQFGHLSLGGSSMLGSCTENNSLNILFLVQEFTAN